MIYKFRYLEELPNHKHKEYFSNVNTEWNKTHKFLNKNEVFKIVSEVNKKIELIKD